MLEIGDVALSRYKLLSLLGEGGMGRVFLAEHIRLGTRVALKVLLEHHGTDLIRFRSEAELMARIVHPNTVALLDYGESDDGLPILAMELVDGKTIGDLLETQFALEWSMVADVVAQALDGLEAAHAHKIIHRDIKPSNILLTSGRPYRAKLADFGIAKEVAGPKRTATGLVVGTPAYMAPEVMAGKPATPESDVYSMGCTLFEAVAGRLPFEGEEPLARFEQTAPRVVAPSGLPAVPEAFAAVVARALERRAHERYPSADALAQGLRDVLRQHRSLSPRNPRAPESSAERPPRTPGSAEGPEPKVRSRRTSSTQGVVAEPAPSKPVVETWVLVASLPASRLARSEERRYLASLVGEHGRGYSMGGIIWFVVMEGANAEKLVHGIRSTLSQRYGSHARALISKVTEDFRLSTKQLAGASPLPNPLPDLIARVTS